MKNFPNNSIGTLQSTTRKYGAFQTEYGTFQNKYKKKTSIKNSVKKSSGISPEESESKTNSPSPFVRYGNKNAVGNRGGSGGPIRKKKALKTGEFETVFFTVDILDDGERALLDTDYDKYIMQYILIDTLTVREKRILKRIKEVESTSGGMVIEGVTKNGCVLKLLNVI